MDCGLELSSQNTRPNLWSGGGGENNRGRRGRGAVSGWWSDISRFYWGYEGRRGMREEVVRIVGWVGEQNGVLGGSMGGRRKSKNKIS